MTGPGRKAKYVTVRSIFHLSMGGDWLDTQCSARSLLSAKKSASITPALIASAVERGLAASSHPTDRGGSSQFKVQGRQG
jgi:hypothetical protein